MKDYIAVDVDGHIMEPPDLFENNLEPKYRDRAYKLVLDDQGVEHPVMDNVWLDDTRPVGTVSVYGAVDKPMEDYLAGKGALPGLDGPGGMGAGGEAQGDGPGGNRYCVVLSVARSGLGEFQQ